MHPLALQFAAQGLRFPLLALLLWLAGAAVEGPDASASAASTEERELAPLAETQGALPSVPSGRFEAASRLSHRPDPGSTGPTGASAHPLPGAPAARLLLEGILSRPIPRVAPLAPHGPHTRGVQGPRAPPSSVG